MEELDYYMDKLAALAQSLDDIDDTSNINVNNEFMEQNRISVYDNLQQVVLNDKMEKIRNGKSSIPTLTKNNFPGRAHHVATEPPSRTTSEGGVIAHPHTVHKHAIVRSIHSTAGDQGIKLEADNILSGSSSQLQVTNEYSIPRASTPIGDFIRVEGNDTYECVDGQPDVDYPIRGTISPLTNQHIQRSLGHTGDELSFVFGRPSSPCIDEQDSERCLSPITEQRPLSPSSEMLTMKQNMCNMMVKNEGRIVQGGVCCEHCNNCLIELKRQALRIMFPDNASRNTFIKPVNYIQVEEMLQVPENFRRYLKRERCDVCETPIRQLKQEAVAMIQSIQQAQSASSHPANISALVGSYNIGAHHPHQRQPIRYLARSTKSVQFANSSTTGIPLAAQAQAYLEQNQNARNWIKSPKHHNPLIQSRGSGQERIYAEVKNDNNMGPHGRPPLPNTAYHHHYNNNTRCGSPIIVSSGIPTPTGGFLARAAQKMSKKKKRHQPPDPEPPPFPTNFCDIIRCSSPPAPPCLLRGLGRLLNPGVGKVKVMLKICSPIIPGQTEQGGRSFLTIDPRRKQVTVHDPAASGYITSSNRRAAVAAPKMFAFDGVFSPDDSLSEVCAGSLSEILQSVIGGADGCLFSYGHSKLGKSFTMIGKDHSPQTLGVIPCAISWLFKLISEQKESTGARFSVRVSAVEVSGTQENLKDLLFDVAGGGEGPPSNGVYLREDPICGTQLENQSELRAPTADRAAFYFDAALAATSKNAEEDGRSSHLLFTLHVYQYRIEKANRAGLPGVAGGRSRLHLIDLGSTAKSKDPSNASLSLSALGNVIMALLNGQRHLPHRDSKIAQLLRDSLGNTTCRTCIIVHVSSALPHHTETLQVIQMAARMHRMKRRKSKISSTSSEDSSNDGSGNFHRPYRGLRMGTLREDVLYSSSLSDPDNYTSSSEQSCDTAIYLGSNGHSLSDRDFTDNEGPPRSVPRTNPRLPRRPGGSRSSGDEGSASDSGRSMTYSDHHRVMTSPGIRQDIQQNVLQMHSAPNSPQHHSPSYSSRHVNPHAKPLVSKPQLPADVRDGSPHLPERSPKHGQSSRRSKVSDPHKPVKGEQWIDGPGGAIYTEPTKVSEQWVDGPQIFKKGHPQSPKPESSRKKLKNVVVSSEERWIDGPREMLTSNKTSSSSKTPREIPPSSPSPKLKHASSSGLKQAVIKQIDSKLIRPDSMVSTDSNISTHVEAASSRPVSISSNDGTNTQIKDTIDISENMVVKPFVRDWVERHHTESESQTMVGAEDLTKPKFQESVIKKLQTVASTYKSPVASPALSRKEEVPSIFPKEPDTSKRVTEWVRSVSTEIPDILENSSVCMADAETNTDHDSDFEQLASKVKLNVTFDSAEPEVNIVDTSYDSVDTSDCVSARDSIYEIEVEERLESMHLLSSQLTDNETLSSKSFNDASDTLEKEIRASAKLSSLAVSNDRDLDNSKSETILEPSHLLLLRKPDGASNPNLTKDTFMEKSSSENSNVNVDQVEIVANVMQQNVTIYDKPSTSSFIMGPNKKSKSDSTDTCVQDKNKPVKTKPPLPHKLNGAMKLSSLPKPSSCPSSPRQTPSTPSSSKDNSPEKKQKSLPLNSMTKTSDNKVKNKTNGSASNSSSNGVAKLTVKPKTPNGNSKLPLFSKGSTKESKLKKKEKDIKSAIKVNGQVSESSGKKQCNDSDSGNDSGIVSVDSKKLLSPYSKITKPRTPSHSSSGHGSDNSSSISTDIHSSHHGSKSDKIHGGTSSGYESMLRESEASCSSENDDSASESSGEKKKGTKRKGTRRSRSAPGRASDSPPDSCRQSPATKRKPSSPSMKSYHETKRKEEPMEIKSYTTNDVERLQRKWIDDETKIDPRKEQVRQLLTKQDTLKQELVTAKENIMMERSGWSFDCKLLMCFSCKSRHPPTDV